MMQLQRDFFGFSIADSNSVALLHAGPDAGLGAKSIADTWTGSWPSKPGLSIQPCAQGIESVNDEANPALNFDNAYAVSYGDMHVHARKYTVPELSKD